MGIVTGKNAMIALCSSNLATAAGTFGTQSVWGISDFSLTINRDTVEQELVGSTGNYKAMGALSVEGSYTNCKFGADDRSDDIQSIIASKLLAVSGSVQGGGATTGISWYLKSCQVTGYDVSVGDASTITEVSVDFVNLIPYNVVMDPAGLISDAI